MKFKNLLTFSRNPIIIIRKEQTAALAEVVEKFVTLFEQTVQEEINDKY